MEGLPGTVIDTQLSLFLPLTSFPALLLTSSAFRSYFVIVPLSISWMLLLLMLILLLLLTLLLLLLMLFCCYSNVASLVRCWRCCSCYSDSISDFWFCSLVVECYLSVRSNQKKERNNEKVIQCSLVIFFQICSWRRAVLFCLFVALL